MSGDIDVIVLDSDPITVLPVVIGPPGPPGSAGGQGYTHVQSVPAATWTIAVPDGFPPRRPAVALYIGDELVDADVVATPTTVTVTFPAPVAGSAVLT